MARNTDFNPQPTDTLSQRFYVSGKIKTEAWIRQGIPANGWSSKSFYESGKMELHECFSHSMIIEQLFYNEAGEIAAHKIYSHSQKKLIDKPKQTEVRRPNVVVGYHHMGFYFEHLPAISQFIEAEYNEADLEKAYHDFITSTFQDDEVEETDVHWGIKGKNMQFSIWLERGEGYYQWQLGSRDEEGFKKAKFFMDGLKQGG